MSVPVKRKTKPKIMAMKRLVKIPAEATANVPQRRLEKLAGLYGTGLAQPTIYGELKYIRKIGKIIEPKASRCLMGFNVIRPAIRAVRSPNNSAAIPCATSCAATEKI